MKILSLYGGVGSMCIGAKREHEIIANIEQRKHFNTGTFEKYFNAPYYDNIDKYLLDNSDIEVDLCMSHPKCGNVSAINTRSKSARGNMEMIQLWMDGINKIKPKMFVLDNLPKMLEIYGIDFFINQLSDYDLFFEYISNFHYGNIQKNRDRLFIIGAKRGLNYIFIPNEINKPSKTLQSVLSDLPLSDDILNINHVHVKLNNRLRGWRIAQISKEANKNKEKRGLIVKEFQDYIKDLPQGQCFSFLNNSGNITKRIGVKKMNMLSEWAPTMMGSSSVDAHWRNDTLLPLTVREKARIQGCPDDFIFQPLDFINDNSFYTKLYVQTGAFIPVEFTTYLINQIGDFLDKGILTGNGNRFFQRKSSIIDKAKQFFCENITYSNQEKVCQFCGSKSSCHLND